MQDSSAPTEVRATRVRHAYDELAVEYASRFPGTEPEAPIDLAVLNHLVSLLPPQPLVLDAGCGTGRISAYLANRGCAMRGIDLSPGMLAMARRDHPDLPTELGSVLELPYADDSFDAVVYWYSLIHLADELLPRAFRHAARVVRPGGRVAVAFHAGNDIRDLSGKLRDQGFDVQLVRHHRSIDEVLAIAAAHGLLPCLQLLRDPVGDAEDPQAFAILVKAR